MHQRAHSLGRVAGGNNPGMLVPGPVGIPGAAGSSPYPPQPPAA
jgi:hypothetical protein